ncbi:MAG: HTH domain-containing protein [Lachnospiraceae bacterium]|nr:HTH domain-containing protein [Lachnospiraceae bacterium]
MKTKEVVLSILEQKKNTYVSGHAISEAAHVSRTAVWKAVEELRRAGYEIDSAPKRGYRLAEGSDVISAEGIAVCLSHKDLAERIVVFDELESTNLTAKLNVISGMTGKSVIIARRQSAGTGHGKTEYHSPEGGIYLSLIKEPQREEPRLKAADIGRTVSAVIAGESGKETRLDKATNRIFIGQQKVCGVLTEIIADLETGEISAYIIGIGIQLAGIRKNRMIAALIEAFLGENA